ncbi:MAG: dTDP-4-dehydrorhamnose 3,5-epimerase family protein, partial [Solirubrobacteraceae bacterium]
MRALSVHLPGLVVIEPTVHADERGFFCETYRHQWHAEVGSPEDELFIQDNHSRSTRGVLRGLH